MLTLLAAEGPNGSWIPSDVNEFIWGSIAFSIVMLLFFWKGVPAIKKAMDNNAAKIAGDLDAAKAAKAEAEAELAALKSNLGDADAEAKAIVDDAKAQAKKLKADLTKQAKADIAAAKERSLAEIDAQRDQALTDIRVAIADQARTAADAVVMSNLDDDTIQRNLIDEYISGLTR